MEDGDVADLVAYLQLLGREPVPGITETEIRVAMLLPDRGPLAGIGAAVRDMLAAQFAEVASRGGLFRRRPVLVPVAFDPTQPGAAAAAVRRELESANVFCFLANLGVPPADEALSVLSAEKVPVIAPLVIAPDDGHGSDRHTFHIYASVRDQARVMLDFLAEERRGGATRVALVHAPDPSAEAGAAGARAQAKRGAALAVEIAFRPGRLAAAEAVRRAREHSAEAVLFFGPGEDAATLLGEAHRQGWRPPFLAPASMVGRSLLAVPAEMLDRVYLASPFGVPDPAQPGMVEFARLAAAATAAPEHQSFQLLAFAGAKVLEEGLVRAGRDLSRTGLVEALGKLWQFPTGVTPPLTYHENRRVGAAGAAILKLDHQRQRLILAAPWREPRS
jgi:ABC-type branched-subunit amino acid transport system substrate-binding protein